MSTLKRLLRFFRVTDEQGDLSLTNLPVLVTGLVALAPELLSLFREVGGPALGGDYAPLGLFVAALASYQAKRWVREHASKAAVVAEYEARIARLSEGQ